MQLTIFDLDNTLLAGDSDYAWGQFLVEKTIVDAEYYASENERFYQDYQNRSLNIHDYQRFVLTPLIRMLPEEFTQLHREFMEQIIAPMRLSKADALIQHHRDNGDELMIITATNRLIAGPIGPILGIDIILATEPEFLEGTITGRITGTPCYQEGKIIRLQEWLSNQRQQPSHITFYSDSINDLPLLEYVDKPIAVDPDKPLKAHAELARWQIISLRN